MMKISNETKTMINLKILDQDSMHSNRKLEPMEHTIIDGEYIEEIEIEELKDCV